MSYTSRTKSILGLSTVSTVLFGIVLTLIGLYSRIPEFSIFSTVILLLFSTGIMLLTVAIFSGSQVPYNTSTVLLMAVISMLSIGFLILGQSLTSLTVSIIMGILLGIAARLFMTVNRSSILSSIILATGIIASPSFLWPGVAPVDVLLTMGLLTSVLIGSYLVLTPNKKQTMTYRLAVYNTWIIIIIYLMLYLALGFWVKLVGIGLGAYLVFKIASYMEKALLQISRSAWRDSRRFIMSSSPPTKQAVGMFRENLLSISESDCLDNSLADRLLLATRHSVQLHYDIAFLLNHFYTKCLAKNPEAHQVAQDTLFDLPTSITDRPLYLHIEQLVRLDLIKKLPSGENSKFNKDFISKVWSNFVKKREQTIQSLRKSGELNQRLKANPMDSINSPYTSNGVFLDYGRWSTNKPELDWQTVFAEELSSQKIIVDNPNEARTVQDFLNWIAEIKSLRNQLLTLLNNHYENSVRQRHTALIVNAKEKGIQEAFAFVNLLQSYQMYFEAIDLLDGLKDQYRSRSFFTTNAIDDKIAECEFGMFTQNKWGEKTQVELAKLPATRIGKPQLRIAVQNKTIRIGQSSVLFTPNISLFILLKNNSTQRFELLPGQPKTVMLSPGNYKMFIYPRTSSTLSMYAEWRVDNIDNAYNLSVKLGKSMLQEF